ncbi:hypothetical protein FSP39_009235 [Pinctada imbricata]|uniref:TIR domain-containing protein n=1 Tax=Pinctada imbricata TaxID=66713 RepID=A0AA88XF45_PINIB|nr:hypothetical protein FSP39_009235 [Pinctada imbricata]
MIKNDSFLELFHLRDLDLSNNNISEIESNSFLSLKFLSSLKLRNNKLTVPCLERLTYLTAVNFLDISENIYVNYPHSLALMKNLKNLIIDVFEGFHFDRRFKTLSNLSSIVFNPRTKFLLHNNSFEGLVNSHITNLTLDFDQMVHGTIGIDFLRPFKFLARLKLDIGSSFNIIVVLRVLHSLRGRQLDYLDISGNYWDLIRNHHLTIKDIDNLLTMCVKGLNINNNIITSFPFLESFNTTFAHCLEELLISVNKINWNYKQFIGLLYYPALRYLDVSVPILTENSRAGGLEKNIHSKMQPRNKIGSIRTSMLQNRTSNVSVVGRSFPHAFNATLHGLQNLEYLDLSGNDLSAALYDNVIYKWDIPNLRVFKALNTKSVWCNYQVFFTSIYLSHLDMSGWNCEHFNPKFLQWLTELEHLNAANSGLGEYINSQNSKPFLNGDKMQYLDLSRNGIFRLHSRFFMDQKQSLKYLILNQNKFERIPHAITYVNNIILVDLSFNYFSYLDDSDRSLIDSFKNTTFDLSGNRFTCSCKYVDTFVWLKTKKNMKLPICLDGTDINNVLNHIRAFQLRCLSEFWLDFAVISLFFTLITILLVTIGYRNKSFVIYLCLMFRRKVKAINRETESMEFQYDAFISYCHLDFDWVTGPLFHHLSKELAFKVCIHEKDFIPGRPISEEILRCVDSSKKSIFVVTRNFLASEWSLFELDLARRHVFMTDSDTILIILKDDIPIHALPNLLKKIWWRTVCLKFPQTESAEELATFWTKLSEALKER